MQERNSVGGRQTACYTLIPGGFMYTPVLSSGGLSVCLS
jgi:hypothetical protein